MGAIQQLFHLADWFFEARFLGRERPLQSVVFVTGGCNSSCRHCTECNVPDSYFKSFEDIKRDLQICYDKGSRILDIEGVNLLRWHDGDFGPKDIFEQAHRMGFFNVSTMIPAKDWKDWTSLNANVDVLWVSIIGEEDLKYLENEDKASLYMVVNSSNYGQVRKVLDFMSGHKNFDQIAFNFHTPFKGTESLALPQEKRTAVIQNLIRLKKEGHRIMNTVSGLKNMMTLDFKRYCWICNFIYCDGRESPICIDDKSTGMCDKCGFCMSGEMNAVLRFKPDTILTGLKSRT